MQGALGRWKGEFRLESFSLVQAGDEEAAWEKSKVDKFKKCSKGSILRTL